MAAAVLPRRATFTATRFGLSATFLAIFFFLGGATGVRASALGTALLGSRRVVPVTGCVVVLVPASPVGGGVGRVVAGRVVGGAVVTTMGSGSVVGSGAGGSNPGGGSAAIGALCSCGSRSMNVGPGMVRLGTDGRVVDVVGLGVELVVGAIGAGAEVVAGTAVVAGTGATVVAGSVVVLTVVVDGAAVEDGAVVDVGSVPGTVLVDPGAAVVVGDAAVVVGDAVVVVVGAIVVVAAIVDVLATTVEVVDVEVDVEVEVDVDVEVDVVVVAPTSALNRRISACGAPMMASASEPNQPDRIDEYTRRKSSVGRRLPLLSRLANGGVSP